MLEIPKCEKCIIKFETIEILDIHMRVQRAETDHQRIERRIKMASFATSKVHQNTKTDKMYDCSECGDVFCSEEDMSSHNNTKHSEKRKGRPSSEDEESEVKLDTEENSDFETETYKDNKGEEHGITIKSKSKDFKDSKESIKQMIV